MRTLMLLIATMIAQTSFAQSFPLAGCNPQDFVAAGPNARIAIQGRNYVPRCTKVKRGSTITIDGSSHHPTQGIPNAQGPINPVFDEFGGAVETRAHVFNETGAFGFFCVAHSDDQGNGMGGAILVEP